MVSFGFCLWQGGTRRPAIGDLRVMRRSEDAIQALRPSEPPPRAGGRNEEPQPPHGQGAHHDLLYGRGANLNSTTLETGRFSRRAMRHPARGTIAAAADVCCAAQRRAWQFLATHQPPHHPPLCFHLLLATPPRPPAAVRQGPTQDARGNSTPPRATRGRLSAHGPLGRTRTRSSSRNDEPACFGSGASSGDECVSLVPVAHATWMRSCERRGHVIILFPTT